MGTRKKTKRLRERGFDAIFFCTVLSDWKQEDRIVVNEGFEFGLGIEFERQQRSKFKGHSRGKKLMHG